jgi:hypothetical protein
MLKDFLTEARGEEFRKMLFAKYAFDEVISKQDFLEFVLYRAISDKHRANIVYNGDNEYSIGK